MQFIHRPVVWMLVVLVLDMAVLVLQLRKDCQEFFGRAIVFPLEADLAIKKDTQDQFRNSSLTLNSSAADSKMTGAMTNGSPLSNQIREICDGHIER